jgi:hypothetical protein
MRLERCFPIQNIHGTLSHSEFVYGTRNNIPVH